jgi:DNA-binding transcriptional LysR family regulator
LTPEGDTSTVSNLGSIATSRNGPDTSSLASVASGKRIVVAHMQTAIAMAHAGLGVAVMPSFCEHICQHYQVRVDQMRPSVEFSFYRITRAGRGELTVLDQFSEMFAQAT